MKQFGQEQYMLDVRHAISEDDLLAGICSVMERRDEESHLIQKKLNELQKQDVFEIIKL